jgi:hypothetical protein
MKIVIVWILALQINTADGFMAGSYPTEQDCRDKGMLFVQEHKAAGVKAEFACVKNYEYIEEQKSNK